MFTFNHFSLNHERSTLKIGTDSVLLAAIADIKGVASVLDIGCGCGVIAFCVGFRLAKRHPDSRQVIIGVDPDNDSIEEAQLNLLEFPKREKQLFNFSCESIQNFSLHSPHLFDLIVSNPPFFHHDLQPQDAQKRASKHGDGNLSFNELIDSSLKLLTAQGTFYLILPEAESQTFKVFAQSKLYLKQEIDIRPTTYKAVNRKIMAFSKHPSPTLHRKTLCIRDENQQYTETYKKITRDFYLAFREES